jgi:uncharacterized protein Usg
MMSTTTLVTANIIYRMPDHLELVQEFIWQKYDELPDLPNLKRFLESWEMKMEGPLVYVMFIHEGLIKPVGINFSHRNPQLVH